MVPVTQHCASRAGFLLRFLFILKKWRFGRKSNRHASSRQRLLQLTSRWSKKGTWPSTAATTPLWATRTSAALSQPQSSVRCDRSKPQFKTVMPIPTTQRMLSKASQADCTMHVRRSNPREHEPPSSTAGALALVRLALCAPDFCFDAASC